MMKKALPYIIVVVAGLCITVAGLGFYHLKHQVEAVYALLLFAFAFVAAMAFSLRKST